MGPPSPWIERWVGELPQGGEVLDLACGSGRHVELLLARGHRVVAVDRDIAAVRAFAGGDVEIVEADLEQGPWPLPGRTFAGVVVTNYLWRPLLPLIVASVAAGGVLLYETFLLGNERYGRPRNPEFLLRSGELCTLVRGELEVVAFEEGSDGDPVTALRQRLCARRAQQVGDF